MKSSRLILSLAVAGCSITSLASAAPVVITTAQGNGADAGIREDAPETAFGDPVTQAGPSTELTVRATGTQNRKSIVRFDLTGLTVADVQAGYADFRLYTRNANIGGTNAGGMKIYGVNATAPLTGTWNENTVTYRDAGSSLPVTPTGGHPMSQPANPAVAAGAPAAPLIVSPTIASTVGLSGFASDTGFNDNPSAATRAPGLVHQNAPYSPNVDNLNAQRYQANLTTRQNYLNDLNDDGIVQGTYSYQAYLVQPGYTQQTASGNFTDLVLANLPLNSYSDIDSSLTTYLGELNYDAKTTARPAGSILSFADTLDNSPISMSSARLASNRTALINYLIDLLNAGQTSATLIIQQKTAAEDGPATAESPIRTDNLIFASKEFQPTGGAIGDWAPRLVIPEPASLSALAMGGLFLSRRRKA